MADRQERVNEKFGILIVCTGNICRSPMAVGILRSLLPKKYSDMVEVRSAGVGTLPGFPASDHAISVCAEDKIDISEHRSQQVSQELLDQSQLVFSMAKNHYDYLRFSYPKSQDNSFLLKGFDRKKGKRFNQNIADPIGEDKGFYRRIFHEIKKEANRILPRIMQLIDLYNEKSNAVDTDADR